MLEKLLLKPKTFFTEKKDCGWRDPFCFFIIPLIIFSVYTGVYKYRSYVSNILYASPPPVFLDYFLYNHFFKDIFNNISIIIILGSLITFLLYAFHCKWNYLEVFKVLLFTQVLWFFFKSISWIIQSNINPGTTLFAPLFGASDMLLVFWYFYLIIGLSWIIHAVITGTTVFIDIPYKKGIIPVGAPLVIFSCLFLESAGLFRYIIPWSWTSYMLSNVPFHLFLLFALLFLLLLAMRQDQ